MDIVIVGMGKFGSALARVYESQGHRIHSVEHRDSPSTIPQSVLRRAVTFLCVPTQDVPGVLAQRSDLLRASGAVVSTAKGIIRATGQTALHHLGTHLRPAPSLYVMSGPSFAAELILGQPAALVLAGKDQKGVDLLSRRLSTPRLRLYKSHDPKGVELCGALKNVYAIASGMVEGLGFGDNTRAALNTRALAEMCRIGHALGGQMFTFFGLAGAGDLFLTCSSRQSRNYQFGLGLAKGKKINALLKKLGTVEGLWTASVALSLCKKHKLQAPLIETVDAILASKITPLDALALLMSRKVRHEFD